MRHPLILFSLGIFACHNGHDTQPSKLELYVIDKIGTKTPYSNGDICFYGGTVEANQNVQDQSFLAIDLFDDSTNHLMDMVSTMVNTSNLEEMDLLSETQPVQISVNDEMYSRVYQTILYQQYVAIEIELRRSPDQANVLHGDWIFCRSQ